MALLLLLCQRWEQLLGTGQSRELQLFNISASALGMESWLGSIETKRVELADKKCEIFISQVMAVIGEETWRNPSYVYLGKSGTQLTIQLMESAQIQCSNIQFSPLILSTGPIDFHSP